MVTDPSIMLRTWYSEARYLITASVTVISGAKRCGFVTRR